MCAGADMAMEATETCGLGVAVDRIRHCSTIPPVFMNTTLSRALYLIDGSGSVPE